MKIETDPANLFAKSNEAAIPVLRIRASDWEKRKRDLPKRTLTWAQSSGFKAQAGQMALIPDDDGNLVQVLFGMADAGQKTASFAPLSHGALARQLPAGTYEFETGTERPMDDLGWAMGGYEFSAYRSAGNKGADGRARLVAKGGDEARRLVEAVFIARDLINTPANDMGPNALEAAFRNLAKAHKAEVSVIKGDGLLKNNFPMVHAVGRASEEPPRVLDMVWGNTDHPKLTLVGKGVTFDTGGLNIKPGSSMALMKKDMGGAANVMALAHLVMDAKLPVRLRVIVGAVENSIAGNAFRPGDVLQSRKGISVEIGNTDAEGRLVLGDCLALGDEDKPEMMVDMATLTGAARVALGPDLPPFYTDDDAFAQSLFEIGNTVADPVWRMPLWTPYHALMASKVADVNHINTAGTGFAGSITAALFLSRFVEQANTWAHFDIFGWVPSDKPWAKTGGEAQAIRALYALFCERFKK